MLPHFDAFNFLIKSLNANYCSLKFFHSEFYKSNFEKWYQELFVSVSPVAQRYSQCATLEARKNFHRPFSNISGHHLVDFSILEKPTDARGWA